MITKTLSPENQFQFVCPIFNATTKIAACFVLRDMVWRGEGPSDKRQGCQCAMEAGKCPIPTVITHLVRDHNGRNFNDPYHSAEPKIGSLNADVLDKTAKTLIPDRIMRRYAISPQEEKLMVQANEDARSGKFVAPKKPRRQEKIVDMEDVKAAAPSPAPVATDASELVKAAQSGDMGAAINAEVGQ